MYYLDVCYIQPRKYFGHQIEITKAIDEICIIIQSIVNRG
jgi:hypothetical protein